MTAKKILFPLISLLMLLAVTGCDDNDNYGGYREELFFNLTSRTWFADQTEFDEFRHEYYTASYWDFYDNGTGVWDVYTEVDGFNSQQTRNYFSWAFTDESCSVIALNFQNHGIEYWTIDRMTPDFFSSYVSEFDPYYYPETPYYYQEFRALRD